MQDISPGNQISVHSGSEKQRWSWWKTDTSHPPAAGCRRCRTGLAPPTVRTYGSLLAPLSWLEWFDRVGQGLSCHWGCPAGCKTCFGTWPGYLVVSSCWERLGPLGHSVSVGLWRMCDRAGWRLWQRTALHYRRQRHCPCFLSTQPPWPSCRQRTGGWVVRSWITRSKNKHVDNIDNETGPSDHV